MCDIIINIFSGLLLTLILFLLNEYCFAKHNLSGEWETKLKIDKTSYKDFKNLIIYYKVHMLQSGYELSGSGEKIKEVNTENETLEYERKDRVIIKIKGFYEHKYFRNSKVYLNILEEGKERESRTTYTLEIEDSRNLKGIFISTAADSKGEIIMRKS